MTTIAYRNGVLASDSCITGGGDWRVGSTVKIGRIGPVLYGAAGRTALCMQFCDWVKGGMQGPPPKMLCGEGDERAYATGVVFPWDNLCIRFEPDGPIRMDGDYFAEGSGAAAARGALSAGADAVEAIKAAIYQDAWTGAPVQMVRRARAKSRRYPTTKTEDGFTYPFE